MSHEKTMADIIAAHYEANMVFSGIGGVWTSQCICSWDSIGRHTYGMAKAEHARHIAKHLTAAGFGFVGGSQ